MHAVWMREFGAPEVLTLEETPDPVVGPTDVLIEVAIANVTFVETQVRAGTGPFPVTLPMVLGNGVGGVVVALGDGLGADAGRDLLGRRVVSSLRGSGGYAELAAIDADAPILVPDELDLDAAVAVLADGRTATMLTAAAGVGAGDRVLVEAAAGGVGTLLVQRATAAGATVVAAAGGPTKLELTTSLGADLAVDYLDPAWSDRVREVLGGVDVVFDGLGGPIATAAFDLLDPGGRMVSYGRASGDWAAIDTDAAAARGVTLVDASASPAELRAYAEQAVADAAAGRLRPVIGQRFPLARAADAHDAIERRTTLGKTLLEVR